MQKIVKNGIYKHFKGDYYLLQDIARHSETGEEYAVYRALYGDCNLWVRPLQMFMEKVDRQKYPDVHQEYRFQYVDISSKHK